MLAPIELHDIIHANYLTFFLFYWMCKIQGCNISFQVSKALLAEYTANRKKNKPFAGLGLEYMNKPEPVISSPLTSSSIRSSQYQVISSELL